MADGFLAARDGRFLKYPGDTSFHDYYVIVRYYSQMTLVLVGLRFE